LRRKQDVENLSALVNELGVFFMTAKQSELKERIPELIVQIEGIVNLLLKKNIENPPKRGGDKIEDLLIDIRGQIQWIADRISEEETNHKDYFREIGILGKKLRGVSSLLDVLLPILLVYYQLN
jgi:hypothetical protein